MLIAALVVAGVGLIACGVAYGYRVALQHALETNEHLRQQNRYLSGAPEIQAPPRIVSGQR